MKRFHRQAVPPLKNAPNPPYGIDEFKAVYPYFFTVQDEDDDTDPNASPDPFVSVPLIPVEVLEMYIVFAHSCVKIWRYHEGWKLCISLFIAHFVELYMRSMVEPGSDAAQIVNAGQTKGLVASKSVDGVSVSYNFAQAAKGLEGWAEWMTTEYGAQFATLARMYSPRSIYIP
jgi:hypothetical protein